MSCCQAINQSLEVEAAMDTAPSAQSVIEKPTGGEAWSISFSAPKKKRKITKREKAAMDASEQNTTSEVIDSETGEDGGVSSSAVAMKVVDGNKYIDLEIAIPRNLKTTQAQLQARNYIDQKSLMCMCRQYKASCGVSSLTSVWNSLYSVIGHGTLPPVSQEEVMSLLGFKPPFENIRWGPFTGNTTLMRWFHAINNHFGVKGKCSYLWKAHGYGKTYGIAPIEAKKRIQEAVQSEHCAMIYHCHNHYMVPLGYMDQPRTQIDVFSEVIDYPESFLIIGEVSRGKHPPLHIKRWEDIEADITAQSPNFFNIRQTEKGMQTRAKCKRPGGNIHCIMQFRSDQVEMDMSIFEKDSNEDDETGEDVYEDENGAVEKSE